MAKTSTKSGKTKAKAVTEDEATPATGGVERVINRTTVQPNWKAFSAFIEAAGGPRIKPEHVGIVLTGYKYFQKSDDAVAARDEAKEAKEAARAEREAAREAKAKERAQAAKDKADRAAAKQTKAAKAGKTTTASKASKPTKAVKATPKSGKAKAGKSKGTKAAF